MVERGEQKYKVLSWFGFRWKSFQQVTVSHDNGDLVWGSGDYWAYYNLLSFRDNVSWPKTDPNGEIEFMRLTNRLGTKLWWWCRWKRHFLILIQENPKIIWDFCIPSYIITYFQPNTVLFQCREISKRSGKKTKKGKDFSHHLRSRRRKALRSPCEKNPRFGGLTKRNPRFLIRIRDDEKETENRGDWGIWRKCKSMPTKWASRLLELQ